MSRKIWSNGQLIDFEDLFSRDSNYKSKVWKYNKQGDVEEAITIADDDIVFSGSKSNLRRVADLERNVSILSTKLLTAQSSANYDSDDDNYESVFDQDVRFKGEVRIDHAPTVTSDATTKGYVDTAISTAVGAISIPSLTGYASETYVDTAISNLVDTAPTTLDTLNELAAALGDDPNFATTITNSLGNKADSSSLATVATSGDYNDLTNLPTIPTNNNQLTNGAGYITGYTVTQADVTAHQAALSITESQISDLTHYTNSDAVSAITANDLDMGSNKILYSNVYPTTGDLPSASSYHGMFAHVHAEGRGYFAHAGSWVPLANQSEIPTVFSGDYNDLSNLPTLFDGDYGSLTNTPTIPAALTDLGITDGTAGQVLSTDGSGSFTFIDAASGGGGASAVNQLTDVDVSGGIADKQALLYDSATSTWLPNFVSWNNVTNRPTIFSGDYDDLTNKPTLLSFIAGDGGAGTALITNGSGGYQFTNYDYNDLVNTPAIPSSLTELNITDGSNGQVLQTDGAGNFSFVTVSSGGGGSVVSSDTAPGAPAANDLWFNTSDGTLYVFLDDGDSTQWVQVISPISSDPTGGTATAVYVDTTPPDFPGEGDIWFDTNTSSTFVYYIDTDSSQWVEIGANAGGPTVIDQLDDVDTTTTLPLANQALLWDAVSSKWVPGDSFSQSDFNTAFQASDFADLSDINVVGVADGEVLQYDGPSGKWISAVPVVAGGASIEVSDTAPAEPENGDMWFDSNYGVLAVYYEDTDSSQWVAINADAQVETFVNISPIAPVSPNSGDLWFDSSNSTLNMYNNTWVQIIGPSVNVSTVATEPTDPNEGDIWYYSGTLKIYDGSSWVTMAETVAAPANNGWVEISTNYTAVAGEKYFIDCSGGAIALTLPASASMGDEIRFVDATGSASTNNITIENNGHNIAGEAVGSIIDTDRAAFGMVYYNATQGWIFAEV